MFAYVKEVGLWMCVQLDVEGICQLSRANQGYFQSCWENPDIESCEGIGVDALQTFDEKSASKIGLN